MNNLIVDHSQLVEAIIPASPGFGTTAQFQDIPNISKNNIELYALECYSADQIAKTQNGLDVIAAADVSNIIFTLVTSDNNYKQIENVPYYNYIRSNNGGFVVLLNNIKIDLTKCFITIVNAGTLAEDQACLFNLYYNLI